MAARLTFVRRFGGAGASRLSKHWHQGVTRLPAAEAAGRWVQSRTYRATRHPPRGDIRDEGRRASGTLPRRTRPAIDVDGHSPECRLSGLREAKAPAQ